MKNHKIEVKNVKSFYGHEGTGINATVYSNGVRAFFYLDDANGGGGNIESVYSKEATAEVESFISQQGNVVTDMKEDDGSFFEYKYGIDDLINELLIKFEDEKLRKSMARKMKNSVIIQDPSDPSSFRFYKYKVNLCDLPVETLKAHLKSFKAKLQKGEVILNKFEFDF